MAAPPPDSPRTPPHTPLNTEPPLVEDSMEDHDLSMTRKRPRLDSGSRVSPSLSMEGTSRTASIAPASTASPMAASPTGLASEMDEASDSGNPSNVTINTKTRPPTMGPDLSLSDPQQSGTSPRLQQSPITSHNIISLPSSPSTPESPEIEVAEPEDIDQDPNNSNWMPIGQAMQDQEDEEIIEIPDMPRLSETFPKVHSDMTVHENFSHLGDMIEYGHIHEGTALISIRQWLWMCVQNIHRLTVDEYASDLEFWEDLPFILDRLLRRKISKLRLNIDENDIPDFLEQYLLDYARIVIRMVQLDIKLLNSVDKDEEQIDAPPTTSRRYLFNFPWLFHTSQVPVLQDPEGKGRDLSARLKAQLSEPPFDAADTLLEYISGCLASLPKCPPLIVSVIAPLGSLNAFLECHTEENQTNDSDSLTAATSSFSLQRFFETIRGIDKMYQGWVAKKSQFVTPDISDTLLGAIFRSYYFLSRRYPDILRQLSQELSIQVPENVDAEQAALCAVWTWKFDALRREMVEGRMQLRVHGVEKMQSDLISIWSDHRIPNKNVNEMPLLTHMVQYLRKAKIFDYLLGIDSHPQLIRRSSNIFGFLMVMGQYTDHDTDIIWKTITESQDDRTVSEVIIMLERTAGMHLSKPERLLYLCSKLLDLPLSRFDNRMINLCGELVPRVREIQSNRDHDYRSMSNGEHVGLIPLKLCVRLIRESSGEKDLTIEQRTLMQQFGTVQLGQLIKAGLDESDKAETYERCVQDIGEMNEWTAGSIQVLNALVPYGDGRELWKLANDFDMTRLVIIELHHLVSEDYSKLQDPSTKTGLSSRVEFLRRLIELAPETITTDLGNILWKDVLLSPNLAAEERQTMWKMLVDLTNRTNQANVFLERCIHEYLPNVLPKDYSHEMLWFTQQSLNYEIRIKPPPVAEEDEIIDIPGMDRIWRFILTAPPKSIEDEAIKFAIGAYLDHSIVRRAPRSARDATHIALVNRCVDQLKSAASVLKPSCNETANTDTSLHIDGDAGIHELRFSRSLQFLRELLHGLRTRPQYSSPRSSPPTLPERPLKGDPVEIRYQYFNGTSRSDIFKTRLGGLSTASELAKMLVQLTRFSKFTAIFRGKKIDLLQDPDALVESFDFPSGLLMIRKAPDAHEITLAGTPQSPTAVDNEVLKHFDELYDLLGLADDLARQVSLPYLFLGKLNTNIEASQIMDFLVVFPPQAQALELVRSKDNCEKDLFPLQRPYKALYSLHTLSLCLHEEAVEMSPDQDLLSHSIQVLAEFLKSEELFSVLPANSIAILVATRAIECLLQTLSISRPTGGDAVLVADPSSLVPRILALLEIGRNVSTDPPSGTCAQSLICNSFAVLVESSLRDINVWNVVKQHAQLDDLISTLLLEETRESVRTEIVDRLKIICGPLKPVKLSMNEDGADSLSTDEPNRIDMLATIWASFLQVIPKTVEYASQSEEFFGVALWMLKTIAQKSPRDLVLNEYLRQWSTVMLSHQTEEFVGREPADNLVIGISALLEYCLELANAAGVMLDTRNMAEEIFNQYLFPDLSPETAEHAVPKVPVMHSNTRSSLYNVVGLLCKQSDDTYYQVLEMVNTNVPRDSSHLENCGNESRAGMLRSAPGYAGLKNLSNTCYLNSLMTQLFMNLDFRHFILNLPIADRASQKLLYETQRLFTWMQESWNKCIEPSDFVNSILTYENKCIDIRVQMDVDEFYNLLFDRWEAQILDAELKKKFRSFYGGQLVQQIKSIECDHISERLEPFSAIQCEIKGKATLEDSLRAYVAGEVMQGDNKYSCTSCGRHVDAVKRACLKDVPDNVIFHLKRFDFDMVNMLRSKINDEFQFPHHIDMTPYTVEHLSDPEQPITPDMFELVGILVHTGTAESGHYYSYTLERPSSGGEPSWVEFNDADVTQFDPATMADQCFGGSLETMHYMKAENKHKTWNAYMLFYQRVSTIEDSKGDFEPTKPGVPVHLPVSPITQNHIAMDNELLVRTYCLLDPQYSSFVAKLLQRWPSMAVENPNRIKAETLAVHIGMETIEQLVPRIKEHQGLQEIYNELVDMIKNSPNAALSTLEWLFNRETSMYNIMLTPYGGEIRSKELTLINAALDHLHSLSTDQSLNEDNRALWGDRFSEAIQRLVPMLIPLWSDVQVIPRVFDDYFKFIVGLCKYGTIVVQMLLDQGYFALCLEILWSDEEDMKSARTRHPGYARLRSKGRQYNYQHLLSLCLVFFKYIDLSLRPTPIDEERQIVNGKFSTKTYEMSLIKPLDDDGSLSILLKMIKYDGSSRTPVIAAIIGILLHGEPDAGLLEALQLTLQNGLRVEPAVLCAPFLEAALVFCENSPDQQRVISLIEFVANGVETINNSGGKVHLAFFTRLCHQANERLGVDSAFFSEIVIKTLFLWAPTLLIDKDGAVRGEVHDLINAMLFPGENTENGTAGAEADQAQAGESDTGNELRRDVGRALLDHCLGRLKKSFLNDQIRYIDRRQLEHIIPVVNKCLEAFYDTSDADQDQRQQVEALFSLLGSMYSEEDPDEAPSDSDVASLEGWGGNSDSDIGVAGSP
ncbi:hypothetical protein N7535_005353 [Penicillium sp. DV-2018c]|nr:hypothetical protein N7461_008934 [Penicillium sp. DV-2018c]KAJ5571693.1 hypothetical protein N7535_005353 [Penicillium sp. DV-2018c]